MHFYANLTFQRLHYQWQKNAQIVLEGIAHNLTWDPAGKKRI